MIAAYDSIESPRRTSFHGVAVIRDSSAESFSFCSPQAIASRFWVSYFRR
jgi:hypothetical protein